MGAFHNRHMPKENLYFAYGVFPLTKEMQRKAPISEESSIIGLCQRKLCTSRMEAFLWRSFDDSGPISFFKPQQNQSRTSDWVSTEDAKQDKTKHARFLFSSKSRLVSLQISWVSCITDLNKAIFWRGHYPS